MSRYADCTTIKKQHHNHRDRAVTKQILLTHFIRHLLFLDTISIASVFLITLMFLKFLFTNKKIASNINQKSDTSINLQYLSPTSIKLKNSLIKFPIKLRF